MTLVKSREDGATSWNSGVTQCVRPPNYLDALVHTTLTFFSSSRRSSFYLRTERNASCLTLPKMGRALRRNTSHRKTNKNRMNLDGTSSRPPFFLGGGYHLRKKKLRFPRLWHKLTQAIEAKDMEAATRAKTAVEDAQRDLRRRRDESGEIFVPRYFELRGGRWHPKLS